MTLARLEGTPHLWLRPENRAHSAGEGTVAAILRSRGNPTQLYALTAGHVLAAGVSAQCGDAIALRLLERDPESGEGQAVRWSPMSSGEDVCVEVDAGLVAVAADMLAPWVEAIDWPRGWADPVVGEPLRLLTRQHRLPAQALGVIAEIDMALGQPPLQYTLRNAWLMIVQSGSLPGDSGAAYWDDRDCLVALNIGAVNGHPGQAVAIPIRRVLEWAEAVPVLQGEALEPDERSQPQLMSLEALDKPVSTQAIDTLARTIWGEARGEPDARAGMRAVAHVVLNRRDAPSWWGRSVQGVCRKRAQFSCWNEGDPNLAQLSAVTRDNALFALALEIAAELTAMDQDSRQRIDPTGGATHYHAATIATPAWAQGHAPLVRIGHHLFYRDIG